MVRRDLPALYVYLLFGAFAAMFFALCLGFARGAAFEGPDELEHLRFSMYVTENGALPPPTGQLNGEYHQAPLAYLLIVPMVAVLDLTGFELFDTPESNNPSYPHLTAFAGNDNKNFLLHSKAQENRPIRVSLFVLRMLPVFSGMLNLAICFRLFRLLFGTQSPQLWLSISAVAFLPQMAYISAIINNDSLVVLLSSCVLLILVDTQHKRMNVYRAGLLGIVVGATALTKISGASVGLVVVAFWLMNRSWWRYAPVFVISATLVFGWWFFHNWLQYNDPFLINAITTTWGGSAVPVESRTVIHSIGQSIYAYFTFFARFGRGAVSVADWIYRVYDVMFWLSFTGTLYVLWKTRYSLSVTTRKIIIGIGCLILGWLIMLVSGSNIYWSNNQGRYMLPALGGLALVFAVGVSAWFPKRFINGFSIFTICLLASTAFISVHGYFLPSYQILPPTITYTQPLYRYSDIAELYSVEPSVIEGSAGDYLSITLHWRALRPTNDNIRFVLETVTENNKVVDIISRESHPATGNLLAHDWEAGQLWAERYVLGIPSNAIAGNYLLKVSVVSGENRAKLPAYDSQGVAVLPLTVQVRVLP